MRTLVVVVVGVLGGTAMAAPPCPKGLEAKLVAQYDGQPVTADDIKISACVWGKFAGEGWLVFHFVPKAPSSESGPEGGEVFITKDGTIAASSFDGGVEHPNVRAIDLDGDGTDEAVTTTVWRSNMSPERGESIRVSRVVGAKVERVFLANMTYVFEGHVPGDFNCIGTLAIEPIPGGGKQLVVTEKTKGAADRIASECLAGGRHVYRYSNAGGVIDHPPPPKPLPCPKDLQAVLKDEYMEGDRPDPKRIKIAQCVWGNFAGPGWFVEHLVPWGPHSHAETDPFGGEAFIAKDGTVAASHDGGGSEQIQFRVVDLDGDGVDEIVATNRWSGSTAPESGETVSVLRVSGTKIETVFQKTMTYNMTMADAVTCTGSLAIQPTPGGGNQLVVTVKTKVSDDNAPRSDCLANGKHVFRYTSTGGVTEMTR